MHMNFRRLIGWLTFQKAAQYVNLSRVDPELLDVVKPGWENNEYLCLPGQTHGYCVAVSLIKVESCNLVNPKVGQNSTTRRVAGVLHAQEMQRLMGCAGLLFGFKEMICSMYGWTVYFTVKKDMSATTPRSMFLNNIPGYIDCVSCIRFPPQIYGVSCPVRF